MTYSLARLFSLLWLCTAIPLSAAQPNFLFIMADDCTHWDIGCYGGQAHTPNIDKLAKEGMRFTQCFQAAPMCSPTRHNIYTGLYPVKSGAYPNHTRANMGTKSIVHYLKPLGYTVHLSGKTHIGPGSTFPFQYSGKKNPDMAACDALMADSAKTGVPFCLFATSYEPHLPWNKGDASRYTAADLVLPKNWVDTPETREAMTHYLAEVSYFDSQVGQLLTLLDKHKLADNTVVMVVSEQGSAFPFAKWTCYDAGLQSAMIVRWPGKVKKNISSDALVEYIDITPTFITAAGGTPPETLQGKSMLDLLQGATKTHKQYVYGEMTTLGIASGSVHYGIRSIRSNTYKLIRNFTPEITFQNLCTKSTTFRSWLEKGANDPTAAAAAARYQTRPEWELYDITKDTFEQTNLANNPEHAKAMATLQAELAAWMTRCGDLGQETELAARDHQGRETPKKKKP